MNDFFLNGQGHGSVAQTLLKTGFNTAALRPFLDPVTGRAYITVNDGVDDKGMPKHKNVPTNNAQATLLYDEWKLIDKKVIEVARPRLKVWNALSQAGKYNVPNGLGTAVIQHQVMSDITGAKISMDGISKSERDRPIFDTSLIPLPIIHKDFSFTARELEMSRNGTQPLDTSNIAQATRKVMEAVEGLTLGTSSSYTYGGGTVYGLTNFPSRMTYTLTDPTDPGWNGQTLLTDVLAMIQLGIDHYHYGQWQMVMSTGWMKYLENDFSEAKGVISLRQRLAAIDGISSITTADYLPGFQIILIEQNEEYNQAVTGMKVKTLQWETQGGMEVNFKIMCIMIPRLRADFNGNSGVIHGST